MSKLTVVQASREGVLSIKVRDAVNEVLVLAAQKWQELETQHARNEFQVMLRGALLR